MSAPTPRLQIILNALIDGTATPVQLAKAQDAIVSVTSDDVLMILFNTTRELITDAQKSQAVIHAFKHYLKNAVRTKAEQDGYAAVAAQVAASMDAAAQGF
jgi:phage terminase large subunit-like protein